jgi:hypothetical protein
VKQVLPGLKGEYKIDAVIANGENACHGKGITESTATDLFKAGVDVITTGNHAFDHKEAFPYFASQKTLLRPANYSAKAPGRGHVVLDVLGGVELCVINLIGRVHMDPADCPFTKADELLGEMKGRADVIIVDMHAEATSETRAMGWHLDGRVAAVLGSHTHVPTADEEILPGGTAYLSDAGMTGPYHSVIGMAIEPVLHKFRTGVKRRFEPATEDVRFCAALVEVEESTGMATRIERIQHRLKKL